MSFGHGVAEKNICLMKPSRWKNILQNGILEPPRADITLRQDVMARISDFFFQGHALFRAYLIEEGRLIIGNSQIPYTRL